MIQRRKRVPLYAGNRHSRDEQTRAYRFMRDASLKHFTISPSARRKEEQPYEDLNPFRGLKKPLFSSRPPSRNYDQIPRDERKMQGKRTDDTRREIEEEKGEDERERERFALGSRLGVFRRANFPASPPRLQSNVVLYLLFLCKAENLTNGLLPAYVPEARGKSLHFIRDIISLALGEIFAHLSHR